MKFYNQLLEGNGWLTFLLFILASFLLNFVDLEFVNTDLIYSQYMEELSQKKYNEHNEYIKDFEDDLATLNLEEDNKIDWGGIFFDIAFIILKFLFSVPLVAGVFILGFLFERKYEHVKYEKLFKATMLGNFVFLLPTLIMIIWFSLIKTEYSYEDLRDFSPLHLIHFLDRSFLPKWSIGLLTYLNVYELLFVLLSAYGLSYSYKLAFKEVLIRISLAYAGGLLFWNVLWIYINSTLK